MLDFEFIGDFKKELSLKAVENGSFSVFVPFRNENKALKFYFKESGCYSDFVQKNRDGYTLLSNEEFKKVAKLNKLMGDYDLGPKVYGTEEVRVNGEFLSVLIVENLHTCEECTYRPSEELISKFSNELDFKLKELEVLNQNSSWPVGNSPNFFECKKRGVLLVDIDWDVFRLNIINVEKLDNINL